MGLADIRRVMATFYADNLARSRSGSFRDIAGLCAATRALFRIVTTSRATFVNVLDPLKVCAPSALSTSSSMVDSSHNGVKNTKIKHADTTNETSEAEEVLCGAHTSKQPPATTPTAA